MKGIIFCLFLTVSLLSGDTIAPFYSRVSVVEGKAKVGQEFNLAFTLKALMDLPETRILFEIPKGIELVDGTQYGQFILILAIRLPKQFG
jgi:hypothetical protein